jgi:hypothetical protein
MVTDRVSLAASLGNRFINGVIGFMFMAELYRELPWRRVGGGQENNSGKLEIFKESA